MDNPQAIIVKQEKKPGLFESCCAFTCCSWALLAGAVLGIGWLQSLFG